MPDRLLSKKLMVVFNLFIDESGNDPNQSHFVLAGYLSTLDLWKALTEVWDFKCRSWGLEDGFHMTYAEALEGEYEHWNPDTKDCRVADLARLVKKHTIQGYACDVKRSVWKEHVEPMARAQPKRFGDIARSPYPAMALFFMEGIEQRCSALGIDKRDVWIYFADRDGIAPREKRAIERACTLLGFRIPDFRPASESAPLQTADMLGWHIYQNCQKRKPGVPSRLRARHKPLVARTFVARIKKVDLEEPRLTFTVRVLSPSEAEKYAGKKLMRFFPKGPVTWTFDPP